MINIIKYLRDTLAVWVVSGLVAASSVWAEDGRYRAIVLHEGGASGDAAALAPKVFILDARDGHMWVWEQNARITREDGKYSFGTVLSYQGRLKTGGEVGEIVGQSR